MNTSEIVNAHQSRPLGKLYSAFVRHPRLAAALAAVDECIEVTREDQESRCLAITGESGVGKSTLISQVVKSYPSKETPTGRIVPILAVEVPRPTSVKGVTTTLLSSLGDPQPDRGNTVSQGERLYKLIRYCRVELVILDECQHLLDGKTERVISEVSDFIKTLINRTKISFVLVGMPSLATILEGDGQIQLRSRFLHRLTLEPFGWLKDNGEEYRKFLQMIDTTLPFASPSNLADYHRAMRLFVASNGYLRYTMKTIKAAARHTMRAHKNCIDDEALAIAFDIEIGSTEFVKFNPFRVGVADIECELIGGKKKLGAGTSSNRIKAKPQTEPDCLVLA
jgi:type II secretory pathway predicted ATPase ExeA